MGVSYDLLVKYARVAPVAVRNYLVVAFMAEFVQTYVYVKVLTFAILNEENKIFHQISLIGPWLILQYIISIVGISFWLHMIPNLWRLRDNKYQKDLFLSELLKTLTKYERLQKVEQSPGKFLNHLVGVILIEFNIYYYEMSHEKMGTILTDGLGLPIAIRTCLSMCNEQYLRNQEAKEALKYFVTLTNYTEGESLCSICWTYFEKNEDISQYKCPAKHPFHTHCIKRWISEIDNYSKSCPYCKQKTLGF